MNLSRPFPRLSTVLLAFIPALLLLAGARTLLAADASPKVTLKPASLAESGSPIRLRLHILPAPTRSHPLHLHLYVDGRMALMTTASSSEVTVTLHSLAPGRHEVTVVEADPLTHREEGEMSGMKGMNMGDGGMEGMEMEKMDMKGMGTTTPSRKGYLAHLTLVVGEKKP